MRRLLKRSSVSLLALILVLTACSDQTTPVGPQVAEDVPAPFFSYQPAEGFDVLRRLEPLQSDESVTKNIGWMGGTLTLPEAGLTLVVPPLALRSNVEITMTAPAGDAVAVEFEPHGLQFRFPAYVRIDADETEATEALDDMDSDDVEDDDEVTLDSFLGVYYGGEPSAGGTVDPLETMQTFLWNGDIVFSIAHFSGYACASG